MAKTQTTKGKGKAPAKKPPAPSTLRVEILQSIHGVDPASGQGYPIKLGSGKKVELPADLVQGFGPKQYRILEADEECEALSPAWEASRAAAKERAAAQAKPEAEKRETR